MKKNSFVYKIFSGVLICCTLVYQMLFPFNSVYGAEIDFPPEWFGSDGIMDYHRMEFTGVTKPRAGFTLTNQNTGESQTADMGFYSYGNGAPDPSILKALAGDTIQISDNSVTGSGTAITSYELQIIETNVDVRYSGHKPTLLSNYLLPNSGQFRFYLNVRDNSPPTEPWGMGNFSENGVQRSLGYNILGELGWWYYTHVNVEAREGRLTVETRKLNDPDDRGNGVLINSEVRNVTSGTTVVTAPYIANHELVGYRKAMAENDEAAMYNAVSDHRQNGSSTNLDFSYDNPSGAVIFYYIEGDSPPPGGGEEGNVTITFSPDSTQAIGGKTRDNNSYWVNQDIPVTVSATGEITMTNTASRSYSYTYQWEEVIPPNPDGTGGGTVTRTGTGSGSEQQEYTEKFTPARLKIAGTVGVDTTIPNGSSVTITKEEKNMKLTAQVAGWNRGAREWIETGEPNPSPPQGTVVSARWTGGQPPTGPEPTDTFPAESGHYSLDKTPPVIRINYSPQKDWWSNSDFHITIQADDQSQQRAANVSGMNNSHIDITNNSYTGNKPYMGKRDIPHSHSSSYSYSQSITINQDGLYQIPITLEDLAGNKGIIEINGRTVTTNGTWTEGDLPLDKTNPEPARFSMTPNNPFGATKTIDRVPPKPPAYTVSQEPPGFEYTLDQNQNKIQIHLDDNLSGIGSHGQYNSHTDSSRLQYAWSKSHQQLTEPGGWQNYHQHYSSTNSLLREHIQPRWNPPDYTQYLGRSTQILDPHLGSPQYSQQKEGLWYLHIKQTDRAGNQTITVSPPIYINKIKNLRIIGIADYKWEAIFQNHNRQPTPLQYQGIRTREFPIYTNRWGHGTALGYQTRYKIDTIGYEDPQDQIQIQVQYHALDNQRNLYKNVDIYLLNKAGKYVRIDDINNPQWDEQVQYYYQQSRNIILRPQNKEAIPYEADREEGSQQRIRHSQDQAKEKYNTYESHLFLPYHAKFVRRGYPLDLFQKRGLQEYQVLITFQVTGKKGHQAIAELDYTQKEDQWAKDNKWHQSPPTEYNSYGKNRPTNADLLGKGINKGEVIWWDLYRTIQDDFQLNRYW